MAFKIVETEETMKQIDALVDVDVSWISVVQHGANREPWKILKTEEVMNGGNVIQSVLVPKGADLEAAAQSEDMGWLTEVVKSDAVKYEAYTEYVQAPKTSFENLSFKVVSKGDGIVAVVGSLKPDIAKKAANLLSLPDNPMYAPVSTELIPVNQTAGDVFYQEIYGMMDSIEGVMKQSAYTPAERKKAVMGSVEAFSTFLDMWTDALSNLDTTKTKFDVSILSELIREQKKDGGNVEMDEIKLAEFMGKAIAEALAPIAKGIEDLKVQKTEAQVVDPPPVVPEKPEASVPDPEIVAMKAEIAALKKEAEERKAKEDHAPETSQVSGTTDLPETEEGELEKTAHGHTTEAVGLPPEKRAGVFDGIIFDSKKVRDAYKH